MKRRLFGSIVLAAVALSVAPLVGNRAPAPRAETTRTVYFSAADGKGVPVTDLTAADVVVKEGGKEQKVASLAAATGPIQVSILVDDGGMGGFQATVGQFINATLGHAEYAISMLNPQAIKLADYTTDVPGLNAALARLVPRGRIARDGEQLILAVSWAAKDLQARKAARPVILVITSGGEPGLIEGTDNVLDALKGSGASLHVVGTAGVELGRVLGDGSKSSGGLSLTAGNFELVNEAVKKVGANLMQQYVVTYTLPDGTKPSERFQLTTTRKDVKLIAPQRIPDR